MASPRHRRIIGTVLAALVTTVYAFPQLLYWRDGYDYALLHGLDEAPYAARIQDVRDGHWQAADQYLWEHKANPPVLPYGAELLLGGAGRLLRLDTDATILILRFVAPAALAWLLFRFLLLITESTACSGVGTLLILLEPGAYYYRFFDYALALFRGHRVDPTVPLLYARLLNPVVLIIPFLLALTAVYEALASRRRAAIYVAGVLVGLNFYTQMFYWAYLYAGLCLFALFRWRDRPSVRAVLTIAVIGAVVGSYALGVQLTMTFQSNAREILPRAALLVRTHEPIYLLPKAFLGTAALFCLFYRPRDFRYWLFVSFMLGGYLLLNQNVITGLENQNYHFHYPNALLVMSAVTVLASVYVRRIPAEPMRWRAVAPLASLAAAVWLVGNGVALQAQYYAIRVDAWARGGEGYPSDFKRHYRETIAWINARTPTDSVFLAGPELSLMIPIYTRGNVFLDPIQNDHVWTLMSDAELFERWLIYLKLEGVSEQELFDRVRYRTDMSLLRWPYGLNSRLKDRYDYRQFVTFVEANRTNGLARDYVTEVSRVPAHEVPGRLARFRVDYLAVSGREPRFRDRALAVLGPLAGKPIAAIESEQVTILPISALATGVAARSAGQP